MEYQLFIVILVAIILTAGCSGNEHKTCNGVEYNSDTQTCCGGILYTSEVKHYCCGQNYYYSNSWDKNSQVCCSDTSNIQPNETAGEAYNPYEKHCCFGKLEPVGGDWRECGNACYNWTIQTCCNGTLHQGKDNRCCNDYAMCSGGMQCCNDVIKGYTCYNPETEVCK